MTVSSLWDRRDSFLSQEDNSFVTLESDECTFQNLSPSPFGNVSLLEYDPNLPKHFRDSLKYSQNGY